MKNAVMRLLVMLPLLALTGCSGLDYMIEEYNSRFGIHDDSVLLPGDLGYDEKDMLPDSYNLDSDDTLNVSSVFMAGAVYKWTIRDGETGVEQKVPELETAGWEFHLYLPNTGLKEGIYRLSLELSVAGTIYRDTAELTISAPYSPEGDLTATSGE